MKAHDIIENFDQLMTDQHLSEKKIPHPTKSQCAKDNLSSVRKTQCVSLGYRAHDTDHTDGTGKQGVKGSGHKLKGRKAKSIRHGGVVKDYS